jgi:hypothetical protein
LNDFKSSRKFGTIVHEVPRFRKNLGRAWKNWLLRGYVADFYRLLGRPGGGDFEGLIY